MARRDLKKGEVLRSLKKVIPESIKLEFDKRTNSGAHCYSRTKVSSIGNIYQTVLIQNRPNLGIEVSVRSCVNPQYRYKNGYNFGYLNPHFDVTQILPEAPHSYIGVAYRLDGSISQYKLMKEALLNDLSSYVVPWLDDELIWIEKNGEAINRVRSKIRISNRKFSAIRREYDDKLFNDGKNRLIFSQMQHRTVKSCAKRLISEGFLPLMPDRWPRGKSPSPNIEQLYEFAFELIHLVYHGKEAK